jgi:hypothetical protein
MRVGILGSWLMGGKLGPQEQTVRVLETRQELTGRRPRMGGTIRAR